MIEMNNIAKSFAGKSVLSNVTYEVKEQEIFGLIGPSSSGKTTIINILHISLIGIRVTIKLEPLLLK
ncbi:hypothetical protein AZF37_00085 [endosymbiont 'TC1' of Trimyema compressum]|uniref:ATP-binding cassette domain-containing protein n=1 Tax=endosymbiont 'TC1' of Trimyema compressum TaxID=243899 RepID=UPI0007F06A8C|nr:hypothetical protein AZF37_00085 [endosymbiont 'TC1' of Trimyema compressum]